MFFYLKQLAITVGIKGLDGKNILANRFDKITFVDDNSIFASFLSGEMNLHNTEKRLLFYPFGFNLSQKQAVEHAMNGSYRKKRLKDYKMSY